MKFNGGSKDVRVLGGALVFLTARLASMLDDAAHRAQDLMVQVRFADGQVARQKLRFLQATRDAHELLAKSEELFVDLCSADRAVAAIRVGVRTVPDAAWEPRAAATRSVWQSIWTRVLGAEGSLGQKPGSELQERFV